MATLNQAAARNQEYSSNHTSSTPALQNRPQVNGIVTRVTTMTPNNPNSAIRHVANVALTNGLSVTASIPGIGHLCSKYNRVLVTGGRANDLPGVGYTLISGVFDFSPLYQKSNSRSVYGAPSPDGYTNYVNKSLRNIF